MLIPVMLAIMAGVEKRKALVLAPIAIIPDLDTLLGAHRVYLHTLFIPLAIPLISLFLNSRRKNSHHHTMILASFYYLSHLLLDLLPGPVAFLWPVTQSGYILEVGVTVNQESVFPAIQPELSLHAQQIPLPNLITEGMIATPQGIMTGILFFAVLAISYRHRILRLLGPS